MKRNLPRASSVSQAGAFQRESAPQERPIFPATVPSVYGATPRDGAHPYGAQSAPLASGYMTEPQPHQSALSHGHHDKSSTHEQAALSRSRADKTPSNRHRNPQSAARSTKSKTPKNYSDSSSDSEPKSEVDTAEGNSEEDITENSARSVRHERGRNTKIPAFTGKESWNVWFTRFRDITKRRGLSMDEKLDELLPKLQGSAGEFVYDQLPSRVRQDYTALTRELKNRFRKVINPKTYSTKFSACNQRVNQSAEEYAAELKMLYDKAFPARDRKTRNEDLLRRFLNGLYDKDAKFQVEYVKNPEDIDTAVDELVNFQEVRKMQGKPVQMVQLEPDTDSNDNSENINKVWKTPVKNARVETKPKNSEAVTADSKKLMEELQKLKSDVTQLEALKDEIQKLREPPKPLEATGEVSGQLPQVNQNHNQSQNYPRMNRPYRPRFPYQNSNRNYSYAQNWQNAPPFLPRNAAATPQFPSVPYQQMAGNPSDETQYTTSSSQASKPNQGVSPPAGNVQGPSQ